MERTVTFSVILTLRSSDIFAFRHFRELHDSYIIDEGISKCQL